MRERGSEGERQKGKGGEKIVVSIKRRDHYSYDSHGVKSGAQRSLQNFGRLITGDAT